ncbi:MAG: UDP-glucose 4-epimerase GalE [Bacilli bacterium]|nr:UDP-glucose 4-epimerase GalE [Bacilli bacterium]
MRVLVTGGAGYIGSHTCVELLKNNYEVIIIDNLSNSKEEVINNIKRITGKDLLFYKGDVCNKRLLNKIFKDNKIDAVIHFAGYKAVGESVEKPLEYYENNIGSTITLCKIMRKNNCKKLIFSSSATVYGEQKVMPIREDYPVGGTTNPYGTSKLFIEHILEDLVISDSDWSIILLRYFNPIGADESGLIGDNPNGIPNNLMPYVCRVATGELKELSIFGDDYDTKDGTGVRDYIHVSDLAHGHVLAINKVIDSKGVNIYNLGTGTGYSVLDIVNTFNRVNQLNIPYKIVERRAGDIAICYADTEKAYKELGFKCKKTLEDMVRDSYNFYKNNKE